MSRIHVLKKRFNVSLRFAREDGTLLHVYASTSVQSNQEE